MEQNKNNMDEIQFNVSEIFYSIQGEGSRAGRPCVFVRLQGCELRCIWCDTDYALDIKQIGMMMTVSEIAEKINGYGCGFVLFTGGEPLQQKNADAMINHFVELGYETAVETNGHQDISKLDREVIKIMDIKAPASGMIRFNNFGNLEFLQKTDEIKCVITDRRDYEWARHVIMERKLHELVDNVILSPAFGSINLQDLANWILEDKLPVRLQVQIHKIIWPEVKRGV